VIQFDITAPRRALAAGLIPIVYGDVAFDDLRGFTIISTEQIFTYLVKYLAPNRIVLAGIVDGVFDADPLRQTGAKRLRRVTPEQWPRVRASLGGSHATDVTGGMLSKVQAMVQLVAEHPDLSVSIVSGAIPGRVRDVLTGRCAAGTRICADSGRQQEGTAAG